MVAAHLKRVVGREGKSQYTWSPKPLRTITEGASPTASTRDSASSSLAGRSFALCAAPPMSISAQTPGTDTTPASLPRLPCSGSSRCNPTAA
jgi:hypothetical protein